MMAKIFLDPGHGEQDPGAIGSRSKEKDNVLKVALKLGNYLKGMGHSVKYSRSTDVFLTLSERARLANTWGADLFISLHNNAASSNASGFETFIYSKAYDQKTIALQNCVHDTIKAQIGTSDRGKKRADFAVLRETSMPAVLIEYAFITNKNDENILVTQVDKLAKLTAEGIRKMAGGKTMTNNNDIDGHWAEEHLKKAKKKGIMSGYADGSMKPNEPVTRAQLAKIMDKLGLLD